MTTSGMYGTLVELTDDGVAVLETAPGQHTRWDRRAIAKIVTAAQADEESPEPGATAVEPLAPGRPADSTTPSDRD
jgi:preprotein translocase subunit YajC